MSFKAGRLGPGDWLLFVCSVGLLVDLFAVDWFSGRNRLNAPIGLRPIAHETGWQALSVLGPITAAVCAAGIVIWWFQATRRSPALPTVLVTLLMPVALIVFLLLVFRVLIDTPGDTDARAGGYLGVVLSFGLATGLYVSLRREGVAAADSACVVEAISVRAAHPRADT